MSSPIDVCIEANKNYQDVIRQQLQHIEERLLENRLQQQRLNQLQLCLQAGVPHKTSDRRPSLNIFQDAEGDRPEDNPDTINKAKVKDKMPLTYKIRKWTESESKSLAMAIKMQNQKYLLQQAHQRFRQSAQTPEDEKIHQQEIESINLVDSQQFDAVLDHINWEEVAKKDVPGRTPFECQIRWMNVDAPQISKEPWSDDEQRQLKILAIQNHGHNWFYISQKLAELCGKRRTPTHCFAWYQRALNTNMTKSKWTPEEDRILSEAVKLYGLKNWGQVANCLEGRTGQQCLHRYQKTLCPELKKGKWEWEEDRRLQLATAIYGPGKWSYIAQHVPNRTDVQCRERWCNLLSPDISHAPFTEEEDRRLLEIVDRIGVGHWTDIAAQLGNRTDNQCWRRWKFLRKEDVEEYKRRIVSMRALEYTDEDGNIVSMAGTQPAYPMAYAGAAGAAAAGAAPLTPEQQQLAQHQSYYHAQANENLRAMAMQLNVTDLSRPEEYQRVLQAMSQAGGEMAQSAQIIIGSISAQQQQQQQAQQQLAAVVQGAQGVEGAKKEDEEGPGGILSQTQPPQQPQDPTSVIPSGQPTMPLPIVTNVPAGITLSDSHMVTMPPMLTSSIPQYMMAQPGQPLAAVEPIKAPESAVQLQMQRETDNPQMTVENQEEKAEQ